MICFDNVSKHYSREGSVTANPANEAAAALSGISFFLPKGSFNFITGHSGAGKSTLLRLLAGLDRPSSGDIFLDEQALHSQKEAKLTRLRERMGIVFQDNQLLHDRSVFENVALPLIISKRRKREITERVGAALQRVSLGHKADALPATLSGGEQQRVGIARAVVNRPQVLIADEPTGNLDPEMSHEIIRLFRHFNNAGVTVVIATHDLSLLQIRHHNRLTLDQGRLQQQATAAAAHPHNSRQAPPASRPTAARRGSIRQHQETV